MLITDLRHAFGSLVRMPVLSTVVIVSLGLGIGVNTVIFSWIQARVLHPLPGVARSASLVGIEPRTETGIYPGASWLEFQDLRERLTSLDDPLAFRMSPLYVGEPGSVERVFGLFVSGNYFTALGLRPAAGRFFHPEEVMRPGSEPVTVISYGMWRTRFNGAADAVGSTVRVNSRVMTIVGVAPAAFQGTVMGLDFQLWLPATMSPALTGASREMTDRGFRGYNVLARLAPGATRAQAQAELNGVMRDLAVAYPAANTATAGDVLSFWQLPRGPQRLMAIALTVLQGIMLLLLLAVCGNTANLVLARASARHREMGVRLALGARPARIARLMLAETTLLSIAGALLGIGVAMWGTDALMTLPLTGFPIRFQTGLNAFSLAFALGLGLLCGLLAGAAPALQLARLDPLTALRSGARAGGRSRLRSTLMGAQVALAVVVLLVGGIFMQQFRQTQDTDPRFRRDGIMLMAYDLSGRNPDQDAQRSFAIALMQRVREVAGLDGAAIASSVPLDIHGMPPRVFTLDGHARTDGGSDRAVTNTVTPDYFAVMDIPLVAGRNFVDLEDGVTAPQAIVNEEFARRYLGDREPLGRALRIRGRAYTIVGVARNALYNAFGEPPTAAIYLSYRDNPQMTGELHLRARPGDERTVGAEVRRRLRDLDPDVPLFNVRTLHEHVETNLLFKRIPARMFAVLGPMLLFLAAIGIYAVVSYTVSLRTTEMGVRLALGSSVPRLVREVVGGHMRVIALGLAAGWLLTFGVAMRMLPPALISVPVFAGVPLVLLAVGAGACWVPARRAARVDPVVAIRQSTA